MISLNSAMHNRLYQWRIDRRTRERACNSACYKRTHRNSWNYQICHRMTRTFPQITEYSQSSVNLVAI